MNEFWILILFLFFGINSLDKAESVIVKLEETPLKTFDEIFGEGWWDKGETEDLKTPAPTNFGQNVHHQIDRQNTQIGQIKPNSTDQNPPLTDHSDNVKNGKEQNELIKEINSTENITEDERKRTIIAEFHAMRNEFKQKGKYSVKERNQIEEKIAKHLKVNRKKIYIWKKEFSLSQRKPKNDRKNMIEKFDQKKAELTRDGFKSSYQEINETVAKELGLSFGTIYNWKRELGQTKPQHKYSHSEQNELMARYYEIKNQNPKISDEKIAEMLKIGGTTLFRWKRNLNRSKCIQIL